MLSHFWDELNFSQLLNEAGKNGFNISTKSEHSKDVQQHTCYQVPFTTTNWCNCFSKYKWKRNSDKLLIRWRSQNCQVIVMEKPNNAHFSFAITQGNQTRIICLLTAMKMLMQYFEKPNVVFNKYFISITSRQYILCVLKICESSNPTCLHMKKRRISTLVCIQI